LISYPQYALKTLFYNLTKDSFGCFLSMSIYFQEKTCRNMKSLSQKNRERLDKVLFTKGLAQSREHAKRLILAGLVIVNDRKVDKAGTLVPEDAEIRISGQEHPYVSRGGVKLERALQEFHIDPTDKIAIDIGASTGGFTDCLVQHGAQKVYAVDVGYGQLAWKLVTDPRVISLERTNARYLSPSDFPEQMDIATIDLSFISLTKILLPVRSVLKPQADMIALVKPQFEVGKGEVGKGGIVKSVEKHQQVIQHIREYAESIKLVVKDVLESPIKGAKGNTEFLMYLVRSE
jgi:23S rRNA (cytidine1920-2'-O)/16S rRNA (cytidine1409-2'-O)-methyltransferase